MCEFHGYNGNSLGEIWWTDKLCYFSIIDICLMNTCYVLKLYFLVCMFHGDVGEGGA